MPLPGAATLGGKLTGVGKAANIRNLFGISAAAGYKARSLVLGAKSAKDVAALAAKASAWKKTKAGLATAFVSGAVAEVPLSAAIASADLVDSNRPWTIQAAAVDTGIMTAWGLGLATLTGFPVIAGRHILGRGVQGGRALTAKGSQTLENLSYLAEGVGGGLVYRGTRGIRQRGTTGALVVGSSLESAGRVWLRGKGKTYRRSLKDRGSGLLDWVAGEVPQDFAVAEKALNQALKNYDVGVSSSAKELRTAAKELVYNMDDTVVADTVRAVIDNPGPVFNARKPMGMAPTNLERIARLVDKLDTGIPDGIEFVSNASAELSTGLASLEQAAGGNLSRKFSREILEAASSMPANSRKAMQATLAIRKKIEAEAGVMAPRLRRILDQHIDNATGNTGSFADLLQEIDKTRWNLGRAKEWADDIGAPSKLRSKDRVNKYANTLGKIEQSLDNFPDLSDAQRNVYRKPAKEWADEGLRGSAQKVAQMNEVRNNLLLKDTWYTPDNPVFKLGSETWKPMSREALLEAEIAMAIRTKMGIKDAFRYLKDHGGPGRQTSIFFGVFHYRQMANHDERLAAFEANRDALLMTANGPEAMIQHLGHASRNFARVDQELATGYSVVQARAAQYLLQHMPSNEDNMPVSAAEAESWLERLGALEDPASLLYAANDGSVMPEAVDAVRTVLPDIYTEMVLDVSEFVHDEGHDLTATQLMGLDMFVGGALGVVDSVTPMQPPMSQTALQSQTMGSFGPQRMQQLQAIMQTPNQKLGGL
jgi:hypothetical protein